MSNWTEEREQELLDVVGNATPVSQEVVARAAEALEVSARSVSSKLRKMGVEVEKVGPRSKVFSDEQADALVAFLDENEGAFTYAEIAERFANGEFTAKQVQGKVLSLERTSSVKPTPKPETKRTYSEAEEATFMKLANSGAFLEDIANALNRPLASVRGKALSLTRSGDLDEIPPQRDKVQHVDPIDELGDKLSEMTVEQIAEAIGKTERGVKTMITRRGLECANYKAKPRKSSAS